MKKYLIAGVILVLVAGLTLSCNPENIVEEPVMTSNKVVPEPSDNVRLLSSMMVRLELDDLIKSSDVILTGTVTSIGPVYWGTWLNSQLILTDVIIEPSVSFYGQPSERIVIQTRGGRIDDIVFIAEDEGEFRLGEEILLFLKRNPGSTSSGDAEGSYILTGSLQGKWSLANGQVTGMLGQYGVAEIETRIRELRGLATP